MLTKIAFPSIILISLFLPRATSDWQVSEKDSCAEIYFQSDHEGKSLQLRDTEQIADLSYARSKYFHSGGTATNGSMSLKIHSGCHLVLADKTFMKGKQFLFTSDVDHLDGMALSPKSAACTCPQVCKCSNAILRNRECARAYLGQECDNCDAYFTSLPPEEDGVVRQFPPKWRDAVASLIVRRGCELTLNTGNATFEEITVSNILEEVGNLTVKNLVESVWNSTIVNYKCHCNSSYVQRRLPKQDSEQASKYPKLISIPKSKPELLSLLSQDELKNHPGVISALQSLKNKRSSRNAYILLLGTTGSGKSSAVNMLFDHPNITKVGGVHSTTTDIHEFRIRLKLDELGISNSELRVIDTPGTSDTRGITQDSRFLASLEQFLDSHDDLATSKPNIVLIFAKFNDNRFRGEGSSFVKMLRTIDLFKDRIIDPKFTNVIFVLTHFMSETASITTNPTERITAVRKVIEEFSTLPKPVHIVVAENKPEAFHLPSLNGFYALPNGDLYPQNLFSQMQRSLVTSGDPIGEAVIRVGFKNSDYFNILGKTFPLVDPSNGKVTKYMGTLSSFDTTSTSSPVSQKLADSYAKLDAGLKSSFPGVLSHLQRALFHKNIQTQAQLPQTRAAILKFFEDIPLNPASSALLQNSFNLSLPVLSTELLVGCGYDLINDDVLPTPVFTVSNVTPSEINFQIPSSFKVELYNRMENVFFILPSRDSYVDERLKNLGLEEDTFPPEIISHSGKLKDGYNIMQTNDEENELSLSDAPKLSAVLEYHMFHMKLSAAEVEISEEFASTVESLTALDTSDFASFSQWDTFFKKYGTHVVTSAFGGGRVTIEVTLDPSSPSLPPTKTEQYTKLTESMAQIVQKLADNLIGKEISSLNYADVTHKVTFSGGDPTYASLLDIDHWRDSVHYNPIMLSSDLKLLPISELVRQASLPQKADLIELAATQLFNASLVYIPITRAANPAAGANRQHTVSGSDAGLGGYESIAEFASIFKIMAEEGTRMQDKMLAVMQQREAESARREELDRQEKLLQKQVDLEQARHDRADALAERRLEMEENQLHAQNLANLEAIRAQKAQLQAELENERFIADQNANDQRQAQLYGFINAENERRLQANLNRKSTWDKITDFTGKIISSGRDAMMSAAPFLMGR